MARYFKDLPVCVQRKGEVVFRERYVMQMFCGFSDIEFEACINCNGFKNPMEVKNNGNRYLFKTRK